MDRWLALVAVALLVAGCAHVQVTSTTAERNAAMAALAACFKRTVHSYDDGVSPVSSVARAIARSGCRPELRYYAAVQTRGLSGAYARPLHDLIMGGDPLVDLVRRERAEKRIEREAHARRKHR